MSAVVKATHSISAPKASSPSATFAANPHPVAEATNPPAKTSVNGKTKRFPGKPLPLPSKKQSLWGALDISWDFSHCTTKETKVHNLFPNPNSPTVTHLPDPKLWSKAAAAALVEVLLGKRPAQQLQRWVASEIYSALERRVALNRRLEGEPPRSLPPKVLSSRVCVVSNTVVETTHSVSTTHKTVIVCIRLEVRRNQWIITAIEIL
ncbi:Rv3235 family protein [Gleimia sp. 6138-11-ORH1]|uniref:Rv3235 family protein n=1 Tax=Gleimia sp. 6138-11-ORH1 TaxID=2973937 RepID=UPI002168A867|nr:Rv3235 family protein [Gleimia sp. 6138-11-ORH1]MCS4484060.1 Rv3235 family protein [Gleimia sp. 6138-11-ORH1]